MMAREDMSPITIEPIAVGRHTAADLLGIGRSMFEAHVSAGRLPRPRQIGARSVWLVSELREAAQRLPVSEMLPAPPKKPQSPETLQPAPTR